MYRHRHTVLEEEIKGLSSKKLKTPLILSFFLTFVPCLSYQIRTSRYTLGKDPIYTSHQVKGKKLLLISF